jgi:gelsolin
MTTNKSYGNKIKTMNNEIKKKIILLETNIQNEHKIYSYEKLMLNKDNNYPSDIIINQRECYLSNMEFEEIFKMTKDDFKKLKKWKQNNLKKKNKLF